MNDVLDPENEATATEGENQEDNSGVSSAATEDKSQQSDGNSQNIDWEKRYKGLQAASEKKRNELEQQLAKAQSELESTTTELESVKSDTGSLESKRTEAERAKEELENEIRNLSTEKETLEKKLNQQNIIMSDFPQLAPLAKFIPSATDDEVFRQTAIEFNEALSQYVDKGVDSSLQGASATFEKGDGEKLADTSELDAAWDTIYKYGGDPAHEKEVAAANALIMEKQPDIDL
jgi:DNA repair exonuclease SbcCD ATPase subunit